MCFSVYLNLLQKGTSEGWKHADKLAGSEYRRGNHGVWGGAPLSSPLSSSHTRVSAFLGQLHCMFSFRGKLFPATNLDKCYPCEILKQVG